MATLTKDKLKEIREQKRKADEAWKLAQRIKGGQSDAERMREQRATTRDLVVAPVLDPARRAACEADDAEWLRVYCADVFYNPFTAYQLRIIEDCADALRYGTSKCKAAPRGGGKSTIVKYLGLKYCLTRRVRFPLIIAATSSKSRDTLDSVKRRLASKAKSALTEDYPLECTVAAYVNPWPSRARNVAANGGRKIHVEWGPDHIIIPTWEDEEPLGPIMMCLGVTSDDIQGCNIYDQRPDFVMLDDLDSRDSLASENGVVAKKIEEAIEKTIGGLAGQSRKLGQFYLCTITSRESAAYKYSDPRQKPAWSGERIPAIKAWPLRRDMGETYQELRQHGQSTMGDDGRPEDPHGRVAHKFLVDNFDVMHEGAELSNPYDFVKTLLPDGTPIHVSALQKCYDFIADKGMDAFLTEYQNDPPEESGPVESGITARRIQTQLNGYERKIVPAGCKVITQGIDCRKVALHCVVRAWRDDGLAFHTIDYGIEEVTGTIVGSDQGVDLAVARAIKSRMERVRDEGYMTETGEIVPVNFTLVDAGWRTDAVYQACRELGVGIMPAMGFGKSAGCAKVSFSPVQQRTDTRIPGDGWFMSRQNDGTWLVVMDADRWKAWEHDRWMTDPGKPGCMYLYGEPGDKKSGRLSADEKGHMSYAKHITSEVEVEDISKGALVRRWKAKSENNHYLDASYMASVAANIKGVKLVRREPVAAPAKPQPRPVPVTVHADLGHSFLASGR